MPGLMRLKDLTAGLVMTGALVWVLVYGLLTPPGTELTPVPSTYRAPTALRTAIARQMHGAGTTIAAAQMTTYVPLELTGVVQQTVCLVLQSGVPIEVFVVGFGRPDGLGLRLPEVPAPGTTRTAVLDRIIAMETMVGEWFLFAPDVYPDMTCTRLFDAMPVAAQATAVPTQPVTRKVDIVPEPLSQLLTASVHPPQGVALADVRFSRMVPYDPMAPGPLRGTWCVTFAQPVQVDVYVERYVRPHNTLWTQEGDYVPGRRGRITSDRVVALDRDGTLELYHPQVFGFETLCPLAESGKGEG
ncbi:MAG: hypothetical protein CL610_18885 [Anaerolineaceae bacterium]|nr:hypothetical protein [Anaerolineaceae bacterium]